MTRVRTLSAGAAILIGLTAGCALTRQGSQNSAPSAPSAPASPVSKASPAAEIVSHSELYKNSADAGRDILEELSAPIAPSFKNRTVGPITQVSFSRVGGDNDVDVSPVEDLVAFSSDRHSQDRNIYTKTITGSVVTQKTSDGFDEIQPSFSPDGSRIAFASNRNGNYDIWVIETKSTGAAVQVTFGDEDDLHPSWMPDGETIAYSSYSSRTGDWAIMLANTGTGDVRDLGNGKFPEVSPDGSKILFQRARQRDGNWYSVWTMNIDGSEQTEIISSPDWAAINPTWSPDGQFLAFATVNKSPEAKMEERVWRGDDIYVIGTNGREMIQVTADVQPDWAPCWSRRDGRLYFVSERNGFRNIWSVKPPVSCATIPSGAGPGPAATASAAPASPVSPAPVAPVASTATATPAAPVAPAAPLAFISDPLMAYAPVPRLTRPR